MKLKRANWEKLEIGNIVSEIRNNAKDPLKEGYDKYIGFEHITPEDLSLKEFGSLEDGVSFTKTFEENDVLFGKIRAYLKKVAVAPIKGICSGDILVLRTKNENKLSQKLLPYYLTTKSFLKRAVNSSIGTTLPRTKWEHLSKHEIVLPSLKEQQLIAAVLESIETAIEQLDVQQRNLKALRLRLINSVAQKDEATLSAFKIPEWKECRIEEVAYWYQKDISNDRQDDEGIEFYIAAEHIDTDEIFIAEKGTLRDGKKGPTITKHFRKGDLLFSTRSVALHKAAVAPVSGVTGEKLVVIDVPENSMMLKELLPYIMQSNKFWEYANVTASGSVNKFSSWNKIKLYKFFLPSKKEQLLLLNIFLQLEEVLNQLKKQKHSLKLLKQELLNEILG